MRLGLLILLASTSALAEPTAAPIRIRMAAYAPEGTSWAREFHTIDREVQEGTRGRVQMHWVLGGIAGDEFTALERVRKGQLDGEAGALFCERLAPSMRVGRIVGLFQNREEWHYVMSRLLRELDAEFAKSGFVNLGIGSFGNVMVFSRHPVRSMADFKRQRLWVYDLDDINRVMLRRMGANLVPLPLDQALKAYDEERIDGYLATATAALAFQWSARVRFYSDLAVSELPGCFVIAQRALDPLTLAQREVIRTAVAKFVGRFNELGRMQDAQLLNGVFEKQGLHPIPASEALRSDFYEAARTARDQVGGQLVPPELLQRTLSWLADYRSEHAHH
jgi:TRAP-type C4-dicarboxylate transport system substrate-binding protein